MLKVEVCDDYCAEGECYSMIVPLDTSKQDIMLAVSILYPTANDVRVYVIKDE